MLILGVLLIIPCLYVVVLIHELTHYLLIYLFGAGADKIELGIPSRWTGKFFGTRFELGPLPFKGAVTPKNVAHLSHWKLRMAVFWFFAPVVNLVLALLIYTYLDIDWHNRWGMVYPYFLVGSEALKITLPTFGQTVLLMIADFSLSTGIYNLLPLPSHDGMQTLRCLVGSVFPKEEEHKMFRGIILMPFLIAGLIVTVVRLVMEIPLIIGLF